MEVVDATENENTVTACQQSCDNASQSCQAFTYDPTSQQCLLLETPKPGTFSPNTVSYYVTSSSPSFLNTQFNATPDTSIDSTGLIGTPYTAMSSTDCQTTCQSTSLCSAFVYNPFRNECSLHSAWSGPVSSPGSTTYISTSSTTQLPRTYDMIGNVNIGSTLPFSTVASINQCQQQCDNTGTRCQAFMYNTSTLACTLIPTITPNNGSFHQGTNSYYVSSLPIQNKPYSTTKQYQATPNTTFDTVTGVLGILPQSNTYDCKTACQAIHNCVGYTFDPKQNQCVLHNEWGNMINSSYATTYILIIPPSSVSASTTVSTVNAPSRSYNMIGNVNINPTTNLFTGPSSTNLSINECQQQCDNAGTVGCQAFTYNASNTKCSIIPRITPNIGVFEQGTNSYYVSSLPIQNQPYSTTTQYKSTPNITFDKTTGVVGILPHSNIYDCNTACQAVHNCIGYTFDQTQNSECVLHNDWGNAISASYATTYIINSASYSLPRVYLSVQNVNIAK